jgi:hypothetical protein
VHQAGLDDHILHSSRHRKLAKLGVGAANGKAESSNGFPDDDLVRPSIYNVRVWTNPLQLRDDSVLRPGEATGLRYKPVAFVREGEYAGKRKKASNRGNKASQNDWVWSPSSTHMVP